MCPHRAIVNLLQPASTQCDVGPMCVPIELLSTYFSLPQPSVLLVQCVVGPVCCWSSVLLVQCVVGPVCCCPVCCWSSVLLVQCVVGPVCCWSSVLLVQCVVGPVCCWSSVLLVQCVVGPVCVPIELLLTYFNLPQPSEVLVQCVSPEYVIFPAQPSFTCPSISLFVYI